ncbi:MAG: YchJ family protein [Pseudomonadota bacterium]
MYCPCGSKKTFEVCCKPFIQGEMHPKTAEALMRSRYTAHTMKDINYLKKTLAPESVNDFDVPSIKKWSDSVTWHSLEILEVKKGTPADTKGVVEFTATYEQNGKKIEHHEVSQFRKSADGIWLFVDGDSHTHEDGHGHGHHHPVAKPVVRTGPKIGRNDPCSCGSGKKFKKCCGV